MPYTRQEIPQRLGAVPDLFSEQFYGPSAGRAPGDPWQYRLYAGVWQDNPAGMFTQWNPAVRCP